MLTGSDVALARISDIAYSDVLTGLPVGFTPVTLGALGFTLGARESYGNGVYANRNGVADVLVGTLNGQTTAVLAFRGSDDRQDSINDLQNINNEYQLFANLVPAFDAFVSRNHIGQVAVTGHSLGGAMAQLYMASHGDNAAVHYVADTFGSPGAVLYPATDTRITNVQIADDPAVYLGENRAEVGVELATNPLLAAAAVFAGPEVFPGLQESDVIAAIPSLDTNYVNRGAVALLPDADGSYTTVNDVYDAANAGKSEHLIDNYVARIEALTGSTGNDQAGTAITPTTVGVQVFRFFDTVDGTHFFTASATEKASIMATRPDLTYEGVGLNALNPSTPDASAEAVFRFFDTRTGTHFYTADAAEKAGVQASRPDLTYEGIAFYEDAAKQADNTAVYRFFDTGDGTHFYTASAAERASIIATRPDLVNEGVAFYTLTA